MELWKLAFTFLAVTILYNQLFLEMQSAEYLTCKYIQEWDKTNIM